MAEIRAAGLRGRGGAGYPTADKWQAAAAAPADRRYVVANGYGADPAVRTDATLLERDPFAVIEGVAIAAWAIGAETGIIAVRATETLAIKGLEAALAAAEEAGFVGAELLDSGRPLFIEIRPVQGAYMLGEETVLLKALEGKRGQPEQRPPFPAERGLFGRPTIVQNVQTLALAAWILREGAPAFRAIGTAEAPGTILVHVRGGGGSGVAEVPLGHAPPGDRGAGRHDHPIRAGTQGDPRRRSLGRNPAGRPARHSICLRRAARGRRPYRVRLGRGNGGRGRCRGPG